MRKRTLLLALCAGAFVTPGIAQAQVSLNVSDTPVQSVLKTLFTGAGIRNFEIDADVQGQVNLSLSDVPFALALRKTLSAVSPPLTYIVDGASYHIQAMKLNLTAESAAPVPTRFARLPIGISQGERYQVRGLADGDTEPGDSTQDHFTKIGIKHYDAGAMADLITRQGGIILVPPNFVFSSGFNGSGISAGSATPTVTTVPNGGSGPAVPSPFGPRPAQTGPSSAPAAANNILPQGIKHIYALESDNSLVIESAGSGITGFSL